MSLQKLSVSLPVSLISVSESVRKVIILLVGNIIIVVIINNTVFAGV